jgi:hypothetical protein
MKPADVAGLKVEEREAPRVVSRTRRSCLELLG